MAGRMSSMFLLFGLGILLGHRGNCQASSRTQFIASSTHFTYEHTDLDMEPYDVFTANDTSHCATRCATSTRCQAFTVFSNNLCHLYDSSQCSHSIKLKDVYGARLYEKRILSSGDRSADSPTCLQKCLQTKSDCGKCGRPNHGGKFCENVCPSSWKIHPTTSKCYKQYKDSVISYYWAKEACKAENAGLAIDNSREIHEFLEDEFSDRTYVIDLTLKLGEWRHSDGTTSQSYNAWTPGQPWGSETDCVAYVPLYSLSVSFAECDSEAHWFCSLPKGSPDCETSTEEECSVIFTTLMTFDDAVKRCVDDKSGTLITIDNRDAWNDIVSGLEPPAKPIFLGHRKPPSNNNDINQVKDYHDGKMGPTATFLAETPTIWYDIHHETKYLGDCVVLKRKPNFKWRDFNCKIGAKYICEYQMKNASDECPTSYIYQNDACLKISADVLKYEDAEKACERNGARLVVITDEKLHETVQWLMFKDVKTDFYIGLTDRSEEGTFRWADGAEWSLSPEVFSSFDLGYPQGYDVKCAVLNQAGKWSSVSCDAMPDSTYALCVRNSEERLRIFSSGKQEDKEHDELD